MSTNPLKDHIRPGVMAFLMIIGCWQMVGDLLGVTEIKALGAATVASPLPKVFTAHEGFETYSSRFFIEWTDKQGQAHKKQITPEVYYHGVQGPYNRRNAYGAALSYGPVLYNNPKTRPMFESVFNYALCGKAPMLRESGIDPESISGKVRVRLEPRQNLPEDHSWKLVHETTCTR